MLLRDQRTYGISMISISHHATLLFCLLVATSSHAQTYAMKTLDGSGTVIKIQDNTAAADTSAPLIISCSTDKLIVHNYWAAGEVKVLNRRFLQVRYYKRGGSDLGIGSTLLLCISHGKLRQVMHIESYFSDIQLTPGTSYEYVNRKTTDARLLIDAKDIAHITVCDSLVHKQKTTDVSNKKYTVKYDFQQRIFSNYQKQINTTLSKLNYKTNHLDKQHFSGTVPAFRLGSEEYIFVVGRWYSKSRNDTSYSSVD